MNNSLPSTMLAIVEMVGYDAAFALVRELGGRHLYIAVTGKSGESVEGRLIEIVGEPAARALIQRYKNASPYIPLCAAALRDARNADIIREFDRLTTGDEAWSSNRAVDYLAEQHRMAARSVWRILKSPPQAQPPPQLAMF